MAFKLDEDVAPEVERVAREIILMQGGNPDTPVQPGEPKGFSTPVGVAYSIVPGVSFPLWRFYIGAAKGMLRVTCQVLGFPNPVVEGIGERLDMSLLNETKDAAADQAAVVEALQTEQSAA